MSVHEMSDERHMEENHHTLLHIYRASERKIENEGTTPGPQGAHLARIAYYFPI